MGLKTRLLGLLPWRRKRRSRDEDEQQQDGGAVYEPMDCRAPPREAIYHGGDDYEEIDLPGREEAVPVRRVDACQLNENQGKMRVILTIRQQSQVLTEESSICQALTLTDIGDLLIGGKLSNKGCGMLTNIVRCDSLTIDNAVISCSGEWLCQLFQRTKEVAMINCTFEDAQVICDELFVRNPQILRLKILHNSRKYSFPLLTDSLLRFWQIQKLDYNIQLRAETSFTSVGVWYLSQMLLSTSHRNTSIYLGKIGSSPERCRSIEMPKELRIEFKGRRFFVKDLKERIYISFDTTEAKEDPTFGPIRQEAQNDPQPRSDEIGKYKNSL